jgi:pimeloyl-ACP methyl ester carboxylesterase
MLLWSRASNCGKHQMKIHTIHSAAGVKLHMREYGKLTGVPILLIHRWSQSHLCWSKQYENALKGDLQMVALDLRGHGMSDAPAEIGTKASVTPRFLKSRCASTVN